MPGAGLPLGVQMGGVAPFHNHIGVLLHVANTSSSHHRRTTTSHLKYFPPIFTFATRVHHSARCFPPLYIITSNPILYITLPMRPSTISILYVVNELRLPNAHEPRRLILWRL